MKMASQRSRQADGNQKDKHNWGNAAQLLEKYTNLSKDARSNGDYIMAENYRQHAEHYFRVRYDRLEGGSGTSPNQQNQQRQGQGRKNGGNRHNQKRNNQNNKQHNGRQQQKPQQDASQAPQPVISDMNPSGAPQPKAAVDPSGAPKASSQPKKVVKKKVDDAA